MSLLNTFVTLRNKHKKSRARKIAKKGKNGQKHDIFEIEIALRNGR